MSMTLTEIGARCLGLRTHKTVEVGGDVSGLAYVSEPVELPDITLSDPPTDAQKFAVLALRAEAIREVPNDFAYCLWVTASRKPGVQFFDEVLLDMYEGDSESIRMTAECLAWATPEQTRDAALRSLTRKRCPEHTEELERLLEEE